MKITSLGFTENVLPHLLRWKLEGHKAALVTLVDNDGSSPRPIGSQMAICETGDYVGQISDGCAEAAIAAEAMSFIAKGENGVVRFGAGSRYIDVVLPCGAGIDLHFHADIEVSRLQTVLERLDRREPAKLEIAPDVGGRRFVRRYMPETRLKIFGRGGVVAPLIAIAGQMQWPVELYSPDEQLLAAQIANCQSVTHMKSPQIVEALDHDTWTACVLLFHEHDWEPHLLKSLLAQPFFYVGALGSRKAHEARVLALKALGVPETDIGRLHAPIGVPIDSKNPPTIALSIAAEIATIINQTAESLRV